VTAAQTELLFTPRRTCPPDTLRRLGRVLASKTPDDVRRAMHALAVDQPGRHLAARVLEVAGDALGMDNPMVREMVADLLEVACS
jgi:hypothetical protein